MPRTVRREENVRAGCSLNENETNLLRRLVDSVLMCFSRVRS